MHGGGAFVQAYASMDCRPLWGLEAMTALCYPRPTERCLSLPSRLALAGVTGIILAGSTRIVTPLGSLSVLGKGHSSIVAVACVRGLLAALKVRRADSKRTSLAREARLLYLASRAGASPRPLSWDDDYILMDLVRGPGLGEALSSYPECTQHIIEEAMEAAYALDQAGILHRELARPGRHIVFTGNPCRGKALAIDLESATEGKCGSLARIVQYVARLVGVDPRSLSGAIRSYKENCDRDSYERVKRLLLENPVRVRAYLR